MIGFRGASRYYDPRYRDGFALECRAMKKVREEMGLDERQADDPLLPHGRGRPARAWRRWPSTAWSAASDGLEVYVMCEIPSNVILAEEFAEIFDGFSIGSQRPDAAHARRRPRLGDRRAPLRRAQPGGEATDRAGDPRGASGRPQDRHLRPGAERLSGVRRVPGRAGHRQHLAQSRRRAEDDRPDSGSRTTPRCHERILGRAGVARSPSGA